jgi:hypothetical protein
VTDPDRLAISRGKEEGNEDVQVDIGQGNMTSRSTEEITFEGRAIEIVAVRAC